VKLELGIAIGAGMLLTGAGSYADAAMISPPPPRMMVGVHEQILQPFFAGDCYRVVAGAPLRERDCCSPRRATEVSGPVRFEGGTLRGCTHGLTGTLR
jgi:hypothetical protein